MKLLDYTLPSPAENLALDEALLLSAEDGTGGEVLVDFVVDAMDHIAHKPGLDGGCFHLTDPAPRRIGEVLNIFARAGHAPEMTMRLDARMFAFVSSRNVRRSVRRCRKI